MVNNETLGAAIAIMKRMGSGGDPTIITDTIAEQFSPQKDYQAGKYVYHDNKLYKFDVDHAAGDWSVLQVTEVTVTDEIKSSTQYDFAEGDVDGAFEVLPNDGQAQTVTIQASDTNGKLALVYSGTSSTDEQRRADYALIKRVSAANNAIVVYATAVPTASIPVNMEVIR